jgi:DNA replication initiation complex subunit (GINS family)
MYSELYDAWRFELENLELQKLPTGFYPSVAEYMKRLREESRMLEKRALKASLLNKEMRNARRMILQLIQTRYRKMIQKLTMGEGFSQELLTPEEKTICSAVSPFAEAIQSFAKGIQRGQLPIVRIEATHKRATVRFLKEVPAIIGADMKTYGPFKVEDIAALPLENTKILIKQGLAERVDAG